jgi:hypothetical protein
MGNAISGFIVVGIYSVPTSHHLIVSILRFSVTGNTDWVHGHCD